MIIFWFAVILLGSYLIGSVSSAIIVGKAIGGDDIRSHGSGNAGATNALRTYGKAAAALVTVGDCLKSAICCTLAIVIARTTSIGIENQLYAVYAAGFGVVLGHNFPVFFKFKGGKGILVSVTAYMFADWRIALGITIFSLIIIAVTKYVSLGSIVGAALFIICGFIFKGETPSYIVYAIIISSLAIYRHRANIKRLIKGTESKITDKKKEV
ncbi:MAG: glycerol-3-phosphate 1-O-acyltransferase PlsY [Clostridia bacterium]|nr:glycerol-3-phosphate 1-O-acyltransferase PlsY [Clostridia bacterium]